MKFYVGLHQPGNAKHIARAFISINRLRKRRTDVPCDDWIMDSGAFSELLQYGQYRHSSGQYAADIKSVAKLNPGLRAVVAQDYMCEPFMLARTGLTLEEHQRLTIERYDQLCSFKPYATIMPVLQGYSLQSYLRHLDQYGSRLSVGAYVGVGSLCKRNVDMRTIEAILVAIKRARPDLRLHGFGIKTTALYSGVVRDCLWSADSMAWSFAARYEGRNQNDWREAVKFALIIDKMPVQLGWPF